MKEEAGTIVQGQVNRYYGRRPVWKASYGSNSRAGSDRKAGYDSRSSSTGPC